MSRDLIRLMSALFTHGRGAYPDVPWRPSADVYRTGAGWLVKFELAGVRAEEIDLEVLDGRLTVRGVRRDCVHEDAEKGGPACAHHHMEIDYGHFERTVELPCDLGRAEFSTQFRDGLLLIHIRTNQ